MNQTEPQDTNQQQYNESMLVHNYFSSLFFDTSRDIAEDATGVELDETGVDLVFRYSRMSMAEDDRMLSLVLTPWPRLLFNSAIRVAGSTVTLVLRGRRTGRLPNSLISGFDADERTKNTKFNAIKRTITSRRY